MMSMWSVAMAGHVPLRPPVTWVTAVANVHGLAPSLPVPHKPPDPSESPTDGEGKAALEADDINQLKPPEVSCETVAEWDEFDIEFCRECTPAEDEVDLSNWDDFNLHAETWKCFLSRLIPTFGPLGLMAAGVEDLEALVDTGASLTITPH